MKKKYLMVSLVQAFIIIALVVSFPVTVHSQDLTEAQKQERCLNNKNRIVELETQLRVISAELSQAMEPKEIEDARDKLVFVRLKKAKKYIRYEKYEIEKIAQEYNFNYTDCIAKKMAADYDPQEECMTELEKIIATKIDKAMALNRPELLTKKAEIEKQIANHRTNLIALRCDEINKNNTEEFIKKLVGGWTGKPTPWGTPGGSCQIKYENGKLSLINEKGDQSGASISVSSDGSAVINATKWPVSGTVNKAVNSIKWSNKSEWTR